jgi:hypothetical protein
MLFKSLFSFLLALSVLAGGVVANEPTTNTSIVHSDKYPGGTVHTLSTGIEILELPQGFNDSLLALNTSYLIELRKADPAAVLPTIPGVPLPKTPEIKNKAGPPYYAAYKCLTKDNSPSYKNSLINGHDIVALGNTWCCTGLYMPQWGVQCTIMNTDGNAKASICQTVVGGPGVTCAPCYAAGGGIIQIVSWCTQKQKAEGTIR